MTTEQRILAAARRLFEREGLDGLSIRAVAKKVGITPMAIYRHYADKDALVDALTASALDVWAARVNKIKAAEPLEWLRAVMNAFLELALEQPRTYEAAFELPARHARQFPDDFLAGRSPVVSLCLARVEEAKKRGLLDGTGSPEVIITLWALAQGLISLHRANRFGGEEAFRAVYAAAVQRSLTSFLRKKK